MLKLFSHGRTSLITTVKNGFLILTITPIDKIPSAILSVELWIQLLVPDWIYKNVGDDEGMGKT